MKWMLGFPLSALLMVAGCQTASVLRYDTVADSFLMLAREDVENGKSVWGNGSGFVVVENGTNYLYTARHIVFDSDGKLPTALYATNMKGESIQIDLSALEVSTRNHDVVRVRLDNSICESLSLANRSPAYGETLYFYGDAFGAGVMNVEVGQVLAVGPLEFEHSADIVKGMSGGPIVNDDGEVVGLCQKGRRMTAKDVDSKLSDGSRYIGRVRKFGAVLDNVCWKPIEAK